MDKVLKGDDVLKVDKVCKGDDVLTVDKVLKGDYALTVEIKYLKGIAYLKGDDVL